MKILLADADRDLLQGYQKLLSMNGHDVTPAFDGAQAASLMPQGPYDAVILDENLPRVGWEQLARLTDREGTPVIVLMNQRVSMKHLLSPALPSAYLPFPFLPGDLTGLMEDVARKARSRETFPCGDAAVDVARFRFLDTDVRLTAGEMDLLRSLTEGKKPEGRRARTMISALNEKLAGMGKQTRIAYEITEGYRLVNGNG